MILSHVNVKVVVSVTSIGLYASYFKNGLQKNALLAYLPLKLTAGFGLICASAALK